ncbi:putative membrane protein [Microcella putealis]|uniref:Putative membrane protein n=1 Tax=Microcella putealis TaxID=337005 RepID=A0A4Q7LM01_9MICO|nr:PH domain-containing protein [Microcella putealis]RZS55211.1 putative membrane protein [Microcella putealis]TQM23527.1 putative membrane protein [Microcella putealis]
MTDAQQPGDGTPSGKGTPSGAGQSGDAPEVARARAAAVTDYTDGEWHRLHRATPLFRGGLTLIIIIGVLIANFRERLIGSFVPGGDEFTPDDPLIDLIVRENLIPQAAAALIGVLALLVAGFWLSWRFHSFRITDEVVEVRSGILFRTNRKGRLDRIQGINIARPFIPRIFGAAKLEISVAGNDANVPLQYLRGTDADALRRDILRLASGARRAANPAPVSMATDASLAPDTDVAVDDGTVASAGASASASAGPSLGADGRPVDRDTPLTLASTVLESRVNEFLAPELDPDLAEPESVVRMDPGRLIGSTVLGGPAITFVLISIGLIVGIAITDELALIVGFVPTLLGIGGFMINRIVRSLRYSIAATPDGVRVGFGLLSTSNETLPPGRIHSVKVSQPLMWRPFGWWQISVNRASRSSAQGAGGQSQTTILPVGNADDVRTVLRLLLPAGVTDESMPLIDLGLTGSGDEGGFVPSPRRARPVRWFSVTRNAAALSPDLVLLRAGAIWRSLTLVPYPRIQSVAITQGPLARALRLGNLEVHTVMGPIAANLGALDRDHIVALFGGVSERAISGADRDTSHRWGAGA